MFRALVAQHPENPDYKVRWGRLYLDHSQPDDAVDLFNEALELKKDHAGALLGLALVAADEFESVAAELAHKALASDPKLVEAQELLARLALEDNDTAKAAEEANKALAIDAKSVEGRAILATIDWLADKKDTACDPHAARGYETAGPLLRPQPPLRRRHSVLPQGHRARSATVQRALAAGHQPHAPGPGRRGLPQLETCYNNGFQDTATATR